LYRDELCLGKKLRNLIVGHFLSIVLGGGILWWFFQAEVPAGFQDRVVPYQRQSRDTHSSPELGGPPPHSPANTQVHSKEISLLVSEIDDMRKRFKKNPKDLEALIYLGNANFDIQRFDQARDLYLTALEVDPNHVHVRTDLASCFRNLGESDRAIRELKKVLEIEPSHGTALYNLGVIFLNDKKDPTEALRFWEAFAREHPQSARTAGLNQKINQLKKERP